MYRINTSIHIELQHSHIVTISFNTLRGFMQSIVVSYEQVSYKMMTVNLIFVSANINTIVCTSLLIYDF